ncbi:hypothetical protein [Lysinibacillus piscis]|uniref:Uncharacterized protein n=1 Tax=Lysinibacillus piscis TaxID=2518931 RepID=A0ABQ5NHC7_9BACI|nr:hypothetical protein [Lysinibacillus sp. KH24]GLC87513.1 hypothetical protein LYSBPC_06400 [Lysinibacillus sp. KH24]
MKESSDFAKMLTELVCAAALRAKMEYQYQALAQPRLDNGRYDRHDIEHIPTYRSNVQLDEWLRELLIDAALAKGDKATFDFLTEPILENF